MQLCPHYIPVEMLCFSVSIRGRDHQLDSTKNDFHPTSVLSATTWYSIPYGDMPNESWLLCGILSVADVLSVTKPCVVKTSVDGRLLMRQLTIYRLHSVFALLNNCCLASLLMSLSSLRVVFRGCHVLWCSFASPVWFTRCFNRTMTEWLTLNRSVVILYDIPPITIPAACHLSTSDSFRPVMLK
jgi:hypothetical protein